MQAMVWAQLVSEGWHEERRPNGGSLFFPPGCTRENTRVWAKGMNDVVSFRYDGFPTTLRFLQRSSWHGPGWDLSPAPTEQPSHPAAQAAPGVLVVAAPSPVAATMAAVVTTPPGGVIGPDAASSPAAAASS
eukprot:COSAG06_NODE_41100_length_395_cov_0.645270_1_plen_131_part_11